MIPLADIRAARSDYLKSLGKYESFMTEEGLDTLFSAIEQREKEIADLRIQLIALDEARVGNDAHPDYGPCDGNGPAGTCSECLKREADHLEVAAYWERYNRVIAPLHSLPGDDVDRIAFAIKKSILLDSLLTLLGQEETNAAITAAYTAIQADLAAAKDVMNR